MGGIFSGLDPTTEEAIFEKLLSAKGLSRSLGTTVIFATHAAKVISFHSHSL